MPSDSPDFTSERVVCAACGSPDYAKVYNGMGQHGAPVSVACCKDCGLVYLNPRWTKAGYNAFYTSIYDGHYARKSGDDLVRTIDAEQAKSKTAIHDLEAVGRPPFRRVLDIGAGYGGLLSEIETSMGTSGCRAFAIEPSAEASDVLAERGVTMLGGGDAESDWDKSIAEDARFDCVIMRHVLEHLLDPIGVFTKISDTLSDQGLAYIAVPNLARMPANQPIRTYWFRAVHTFYFSAEHVVYMAAKGGLRLVSQGENGGELWCIFEKGAAGIPKPRLFASNMKLLKAALAADIFRPARLARMVKARLKAVAA